MSSLPIEIADAVTAELAAGDFSRQFAPVRQVLPAAELEELAALKVTVVPKAIEIERSTRASCHYDISIDIGIQQKLGSDLDGEVADLCGLVSEIAEFLQSRQLSAAPWATWLRLANEPIYSPELLHEKRVFTSVLTCTYRAVK